MSVWADILAYAYATCSFLRNRPAPHLDDTSWIVRRDVFRDVNIQGSRGPPAPPTINSACSYIFQRRLWVCVKSLEGIIPAIATVARCGNDHDVSSKRRRRKQCTAIRNMLSSLNMYQAMLRAFSGFAGAVTSPVGLNSHRGHHGAPFVHGRLSACPGNSCSGGRPSPAFETALFRC